MTIVEMRERKRERWVCHMSGLQRCQVCHWEPCRREHGEKAGRIYIGRLL